VSTPFPCQITPAANAESAEHQQTHHQKKTPTNNKTNPAKNQRNDSEKNKACTSDMVRQHTKRTNTVEQPETDGHRLDECAQVGERRHE
jgi:hypothetical protein